MSVRYPPMKFSELERDVLRWIVRTSDDEALVQQLMDAKPRRREFTGHGSFTDLRVPPHLPKARQGVYHEGFPLVKSDELPCKAGCVLFCRDGLASMLEFYM